MSVNINTNNGNLIITKLKGNIISLLLDEKGRAASLSVCSPEDSSLIGNIYIGRVANIVPSMNAAFIECPGKITGYLKIRDDMSAEIRPGNKVLVQVTNDSIKGKNPTLTTEISLVGKYCILHNTDPGLSFSSKFSDPEKKKQITSLYNSTLSYDDTGFIIRTNSLYDAEESIINEMKRLHKIWSSVLGSAENKFGISLIYKAPSLYLQDIRDTYENLFSNIITDDRDIYSECEEYISEYQPEDNLKLKLFENQKVSLAAAYDIKKHLTKALDRRVWLHSGAYILIEPTQALTAIDVNTGKYVSNKDPEKEFLKINQEAAAEIARQIRLRNLSGIIIIDFINLKKSESKKLLLDYLKTQLKFDPVKTNIIEMTKLDLVELTRPKIRRPIYEILDISMLQ